MTGPLPPGSEAPIQREEELLEHFAEGARPPEAWGCGLEYERFAVDAASGRALPYEGGRGIEALLNALASQAGWTPEEEEGRVIGLRRDDSRISLEPGGQVELSGRVHRRLDGMRREVAEHLRETAAAAAGLGAALLPVGVHPVSRVEEIGWTPKGRYDLMAPFLGARGDLAHHMMKATAGIQLNLDHSGEEDAADKLRTAFGITSIVTAAFANSPVYAGRPIGLLARRAQIWARTDPARCGLPEFVFRDDLSFRSWLEYALDVPTIFLRRGGSWIGTGGAPFRSFVRDGHRGLRATRADWALHLTTIFTEVRLKTYLEVRGADSVSPALALAQAALWKGILYDPEARRKAWTLVADVPYAARIGFHREVAEKAVEARLAGVEARELALELVRIARDGLGRIDRSRSEDDPPEGPLLSPLEGSLREEGGSPAARLSRAWDRGGPVRMAALIAEAARDEEDFLAGDGAGGP